MNRALLIFLGAFLVLSFSWAGLVLTNQVGYGSLAPHFDDTENKAYPGQTPGRAAQGAMVYQDLGCAYCHTQQVRGGVQGADIGRKWGVRDSYARDYLRDPKVQLGDLRVGPDLRNVGARYSDAAALFLSLYDPGLAKPAWAMPSYSFLFEKHRITGEPSPLALKVPVAAGFEVVPTPRAVALVAYLLNLNDTYDYPEESQMNTPPAPAKKAEPGKAGPAAAPSKTPTGTVTLPATATAVGTATTAAPPAAAKP
jgi:cytochrome c oxidase cbb3-type subunit 2